jgi:hypothetical protein
VSAGEKDVSSEVIDEAGDWPARTRAFVARHFLLSLCGTSARSDGSRLIEIIEPVGLELEPEPEVDDESCGRKARGEVKEADFIAGADSQLNEKRSLGNR